MHRIDVPSATVDNQFTDGSPTGGVPATIVPASWLNDLQENVVEVIEGAGITLVKGDHFQLLAAITDLIADEPISQSLGTSGFRVLKGGMIIQWGVVDGSIANDALVTLPTTFPNNVGGFAAVGFASTKSEGSPFIYAPTNSNFRQHRFNAAGTAVTVGFRWVAVGH
jgi:hypothetical protein